MSFFTDKVVVVTGGSDGIGKALVEDLIKRGAKVSTCGRNHDKIYQLQTQHPGTQLIAHAVDVSNEQECQKFIEKTIHAYGKIDILVNNAGISMRALFMDTTLDTMRRVMDVNYWGSVYCTWYALPHILKQKGTVAGISSIAGYRGLPGRSGYSASKFALNGWLEALRTELLDTGVNVLWVSPGFTASNIRNTALDKNAKPHGDTPMDESKLMTSSECSKHILDAIENRKRSVVLTLQGKETVLMNNFLPAFTDRLIKKFFFKDGKLIK